MLTTIKMVVFGGAFLAGFVMAVLFAIYMMLYAAIVFTYMTVQFIGNEKWINKMKYRFEIPW